MSDPSLALWMLEKKASEGECPAVERLNERGSLFGGPASAGGVLMREDFCEEGQRGQRATRSPAGACCSPGIEPLSGDRRPLQNYTTRECRTPKTAQGPPPARPASQVNPMCKPSQMPASPFQQSPSSSLGDSARMDEVPHCPKPAKESPPPAASSLELTRSSSLPEPRAKPQRAPRQSRPRLKQVLSWKMSANQAYVASESESGSIHERRLRGSRTFHYFPGQGKASTSQSSVFSDTCQSVSPRSSVIFSSDDAYVGGFALSKTQGRRSSWCQTLEYVGPAAPRIHSLRPHEPNSPTPRELHNPRPHEPHSLRPHEPNSPRPHDPQNSSRPHDPQNSLRHHEPNSPTPHEPHNSPRPQDPLDEKEPPSAPTKDARNPPLSAKTGKTASCSKRLQGMIKRCFGEHVNVHAARQ
ncbi:hypothetical protein DUNSADRAFT_16201 [Dunaliella salina]|uniref:Encoded protein n=1 Tax=Dunaliella salina TaxID=3046 RepID=A0ABQ7G429_DUNSA|nr:hypothetical protein DUNSADRAFT_16201 [Dunaliella salina]|eukprot:KAF5829356.1 hypothetical protein DUNSADRAFT_16201 [Dunaliella salina]